MSQQFILVVGDINIPTKAFQIPIQFREIFHPRRISHVILTGNVTSAGTVSFLKTIKSDLHAVRGPYDETSYPDVDTRNYCGYNISVMNGSQCMPMGDSAQLSKFAKVYDSEIICSGCGWRPFVGMVDNVLVVKPGSLTGSIKEHEPGYADDSSYCFSQGSQPGEDASSLTDSDGMKTYVPNPSKVYPYIRYTSEPSFVLLGVSKGSPLVNVFTYIIRDTQLVVSSTKFMVPKLHELPEPQIEMFMHHKSPQEQQLQQPVAFGGLGNPSQTTLPPSSQQFNPYSPSTINAQLGASSQAWQAPPSFQSEGGLSSQQPPNQSTWSSQQVPAPIAAPVQPAPVAAPVQPAPVAAPVQPAPVAAPVQPAPVAAPVQPAPVAAPVQPAPVAAPVQPAPIAAPVQPAPIAAPVQPAPIAAPVQPAPIAAPVQPAPIAAPVQPAPVAAPVQPAPVAAPVQPAPVAAPVQPAPVAAPVQPAPVAAPVQPAPVAAPVQPAPVAAPVQPAPIAAPVQPAPIAAPVQPAPIAAPVQPAPVAAPVQPAPVAAPVQPAPVAAPVQPAPVAAPVQPAPVAAPVQPAKDSTSSTTTPAVSAAPSAPVKTNPYLQAKTSPGANPYLANSAAKPSNPYLKVTNSAASPTSPPTTNPYLKMAGGANETSPYLKKFGDS